MRRVRQSLPAETRLKSSPNPDWASLPKAQTARHQDTKRVIAAVIVESWRNEIQQSRPKVK